MAWKNAFDKAKPVFVTIYATVIIGIVFSSLYVISAIYSGKSAADSTTSWLSHVGSPPLEQAPNVSQPKIVQAMFLPYGFELLMCDTDMVWLKDPLPYLARYAEADVLTSSDQV